ncbi:MAG: V-type ATP synthase subunit E family protein [Marinifilaceae bacterium]
MENKIDSIIQKLYDEGVEKATVQARELIDKAQQDAAKIIADAENKAKDIINNANAEVDNLKKKAESEMSLSARQALTALRQDITNLIAGDVSGQVTKAAFNDKEFVRQLLVSIIQKWDVNSGSLNLQVLLTDTEKADFEQLVTSKYKELLDKGLEIKVANIAEGFVIEPKDGGFKIQFSEELFKSFFDQYIKSFSKNLLFERQA